MTGVLKGNMGEGGGGLLAHYNTKHKEYTSYLSGLLYPSVSGLPSNFLVTNHLLPLENVYSSFYTAALLNNLNNSKLGCIRVIFSLNGDPW